MRRVQIIWNNAVSTIEGEIHFTFSFYLILIDLFVFGKAGRFEKEMLHGPCQNQQTKSWKSRKRSFSILEGPKRCEKLFHCTERLFILSIFSAYELIYFIYCSSRMKTMEKAKYQTFQIQMKRNSTANLQHPNFEHMWVDFFCDFVCLVSPTWLFSWFWHFPPLPCRRRPALSIAL